ncbi:MAG: pyridoxal phosphate-dependent aminotransferase [Acidobacteriota bacterium]
MRARLAADGLPVDDLTESNPTRVGLRYPARVLDSLASSAGLSYQPEPLGLPSAREAVARDFVRRGLAVPASRIVLTASTSDAYSVLFKLLCSPGDEVLVPAPSYPLFEFLAKLDAVNVRPYRLDYQGEWVIDASSLAEATSARTRAVIVVSPNNPTGSFVKRHELDVLTQHCRVHELALIGDEVFGDYALDVDLRRTCSVLAQCDVLTFSLGGLSKSVGLPQLKLSWMTVSGPEESVESALGHLELVCDTYLSVGTPVQEALADLLERGEVVRTQIRERLAQNLRTLRESVAAHPSVTLLPVEGGWSAVLQVPATRSEEALVLDLLERDHVLIHPGYFFDFPREAFLVTSLLPEPAVFCRAVERVLARCTCQQRSSAVRSSLP